MTYPRFTFALLLAALGGAVAAGGPSGLRRALELAGSHAAFLLVVAAVLLLALNVVPQGMLLGPVLLAIAAVAVWAVRATQWSSNDRWTVVGGVAILAGGSMSMRLQRTWTNSDRVAKLNAVLLPRSAQVQAGAWRPERIVVRAVFAKATVDLSQGLIPVNNYIEVMVTVLSGRVELATPIGWPVVTGRVAAASAVKLTGTVDSPDSFVDPNDEATRNELLALRNHARDALGVPVIGAVVVHVAGAGGEVVIRRG